MLLTLNKIIFFSLIGLLALLLLPNCAFAQKTIYVDIVCNYTDSITEKEILVYEASLNGVISIKTIIDYTGLPHNFQIYQANISNAMAGILDGNRIIVYDNELMHEITNLTNNYWLSMSILAHEIGHHLAGHTFLHSKSNITIELEADEFSGFVLYKMGATIDDVLQAVQILTSEAPTLTHPSKADRLKAIEKGWNKAASLLNLAALPPPPMPLLEEFPYLAESGYVPEIVADRTVPEDCMVDYLNHEAVLFRILQQSTSRSGTDEYIFQLEDGQRKKHYLTRYTLSNVENSWVNHIMKPGRRLIINTTLCGNGLIPHVSKIQLNE